MSSEPLIIQQCRKGEKKAQHALYIAFAKKMFLHCYRYLKNKADAEEVLTDGFMKIFTSIAKIEYRDEKSFEAWIKKIMINESLLFLRKKKQLIYANEDIPETIETEILVDERLAAQDIYKLILFLPVGYRTVFNMYAIEGYSHKEIAQMLGINESTSRSQLTKARTLLQELIVKNYTL
ncbi:RNA polymerase sigma factor [Rhodocytophaga rosea]|uniref:RNA polymerase sigma factor n=1 Tax=Rhodocytophaga rosea TaxID=2704465 RepID=UPI001E5843A1|nr:sigma-70 family RNA polymerase sigma factor [Rhodocytophaga rosea]